MKRLCFLLGVFALCALPLYAEDMPAQNAEDNKAVIAIQKQPALKQQKQGAVRNIACIIIQVNGKVKDAE